MRRPASARSGRCASTSATPAATAGTTACSWSCWPTTSALDAGERELPVDRRGRRLDDGLDRPPGIPALMAGRRERLLLAPVVLHRLALERDPAGHRGPGALQDVVRRHQRAVVVAELLADAVLAPQHVGRELDRR